MCERSQAVTTVSTGTCYCMRCRNRDCSTSTRRYSRRLPASALCRRPVPRGPGSTRKVRVLKATIYPSKSLDHVQPILRNRTWHPKTGAALETLRAFQARLLHEPGRPRPPCAKATSQPSKWTLTQINPTCLLRAPGLTFHGMPTVQPGGSMDIDPGTTSAASDVR